MMNLVLMIGTSELLLIAGLVLLLFGGKKLPEMMKGLGQGVRSFKEGMKETVDNPDETTISSETSQDSSEKKDTSNEQVKNNGK